MIKHCSGGIILGFEQYNSSSMVYRRGVKGKEKKMAGPIVFPTPWNQLEAGILYSFSLPLLIFKEPGIEGGIFDVGIIDSFTHEMPSTKMSRSKQEDLDSLFQRWTSEVQNHYYGA